MLRKVRASCVALCAAGLLVSSVQAQPPTVEASIEEGRGKSRRPQSVLYQLRESATSEELALLNDVLQEHAITTERSLLNGKIKQAKSNNPRGRNEEELAQVILETGAVDFAEPDYLNDPQLLPNDPKYSSQWHHAKIGSPAAWDSNAGNPAVIVTVCDTGVESTHPDLKANLLLPGYNTVSNNTKTAAVTSHGTKIAGAISAQGNNGVGVVGVAWKTKILPVRITNKTSGSAYTSDMAECIRYGADRGSRVVNLSFSGASSSTIDSAAKYLREKGGLLFMSAGNDGADISNYPDFASFIVVGASTSSDARLSSSNYGKAVDLFAPGSSIYTTTTGGSYTSASGTSYATPVAAGVGALIFSVNTSFTPAQVESILFSTAVDLGSSGDDSVYGNGRVNASAAVLKAISLVPSPSPSPTASPSPTPTASPSPSPSPSPTPTPTVTLTKGTILSRTLKTDSSIKYLLYLPKTGSVNRPIFVTVHGISLNYQEHAQKFMPYAEKYGVVLVAPYFPEPPFDDYQRLGRTGQGARADYALQKIVKEVRELTYAQTGKFYLFGYSGGGQFTHRYAMAHPGDIARYAVGAAGWYTFPDSSVEYPMGTYNTGDLEGVTFVANSYLRVPGAVMVGDLDVEITTSLNQDPDINAQQGYTRVERGQNWIKAMSSSAQSLGITPTFQFQTLVGCGHSFGTCMSTSKMGDVVFQWLFSAPPAN